MYVYVRVHVYRREKKRFLFVFLSLHNYFNEWPRYTLAGRALSMWRALHILLHSEWDSLPSHFLLHFFSSFRYCVSLFLSPIFSSMMLFFRFPSACFLFYNYFYNDHVYILCPCECSKSFSSERTSTRGLWERSVTGFVSARSKKYHFAKEIEKYVLPCSLVTRFCFSPFLTFSLFRALNFIIQIEIIFPKIESLSTETCSGELTKRLSVYDTDATNTHVFLVAFNSFISIQIFMFYSVI